MPQYFSIEINEQVSWSSCYCFSYCRKSLKIPNW